jgi:hypothetical protein
MSMNVSFLFFAFKALGFVSGLQKYNFFLISQAFFNFYFGMFFRLKTSNHLLNISQNVAALAGCKHKSFFCFSQMFFKLFYLSKNSFVNLKT